MLSTDRIEQIVIRETEASHRDVQLLRDELLQQWKQWPPHEQGSFCIHIRAQLKALHRRVRGEARRAFSGIQDQINTAAIEDAMRAERQRQSADRMKQEILNCFDVINRNGRGIVYLGSARLKPGSPMYEQSRELGREVYRLLGSTSWSGAGPGMMEGPLVGAREAGGKTAGVKIELGSEHTFFEQDVNPALETENVAICKYFGPRKVGLADAAMRESEEDRTAIIVLPGGFGTIDEWSEYVVLKQLQKLGTNHTVPILLMNYEGFFDPLIEFLYRSCIEHGTIREDELSLFHMCRDNFAALEVLAETYNIPTDKRTYSERVQPKIILKAATEHLSQPSET